MAEFIQKENNEGFIRKQNDVTIREAHTGGLKFKAKAVLFFPRSSHL